jgi:hypothetical protein
MGSIMMHKILTIFCGTGNALHTFFFEAEDSAELLLTCLLFFSKGYDNIGNFF